MIEPIDIPKSFPGPRAVSRKLGVVVGVSRVRSAVLVHAFSQGGASVALVPPTGKDLKAGGPGRSLVFSADGRYRLV
jgi:hypothetical protein